MGRSSLRNIAKLLDSLNTEVSVEDSFLYDLKRSIELTNSKSAQFPSKTYKPSSMNCMRASYYQIKGVEPDPAKTSYTLVGICNSGTDIHVRVQQAISDMKNNKINCEFIDVADFVKQRELSNLEVVGKSGEETKLHDTKLNINFLSDGIVKYNNSYYIVEIKTENSFKWSNRMGVDPSHYQQATAYSLEFGLKNVLFIYVNRDNLDMKCYLFEVTGEMIQDLLGYIENCNNYLASNQLPPKETLSKKACTYCMYRERCEKES